MDRIDRTEIVESIRVRFLKYFWKFRFSFFRTRNFTNPNRPNRITLIDQMPSPSCRGEGEPPGRLHSLNGGPSDAWNIIIVSRQRAQGRCFSDLRHSEAFVLFADWAHYEKRSSTAKGLMLGVFSSAEGPQGKNTFGKTVQRQVWHEDISRRWCRQSRSYDWKSFSLVSR